jgi:hypothetical protein
VCFGSLSITFPGCLSCARLHASLILHVVQSRCCAPPAAIAACSGLHRHVTLLRKPGCACITDFAVSTPLSFEAGRLQAASLQLEVQLEVADAQQLQEEGLLHVTVDMLLPDGTPLLQDLPTKLDQVRCGNCKSCTFEQSHAIRRAEQLQQSPY